MTIDMFATQTSWSELRERNADYTTLPMAEICMTKGVGLSVSSDGWVEILGAVSQPTCADPLTVVDLGAGAPREV